LGALLVARVSGIPEVYKRMKRATQWVENWGGKDLFLLECVLFWVTFLIRSIAMAFPYHHQTITSSPRTPRIKVTMKKWPFREGNFTTESPNLSLERCVSNPISVGGKSR